MFSEDTSRSNFIEASLDHPRKPRPSEIPSFYCSWSQSPSLFVLEAKTKVPLSHFARAGLPAWALRRPYETIEIRLPESLASVP